jgi:hypothetical protein
MPRVTLSASAFSAGGRAIDRAAFSATSARQGLPWLGLGDVPDTAALVSLSVEALVVDFLAEPAENAHSPIEGTVAVIPFNAVTDRDAPLAAELATSAAHAEILRQGIRLVFPGLVEAVQRRLGRVWRGELDQTTSATLREESGADFIWTGTVEKLDLGAGPEPTPVVTFSARLIETQANRIVWSGGHHRQGVDGERLFGSGRVYSAGNLIESGMAALLEEALETAAGHEKEEG